MIRLPVSGVDASPRLPNGADEMAMREMAGPPIVRAIALAERLAGPSAWPGGEWADLPVTDFETLMLAIRVQTLGGALTLGLACPACRARIEIGFNLDDYAAIVEPRRPAGVTPDEDRAGWFRLDGICFRLPTARDQAAVAGRADAVKALEARCFDAPRPLARDRARAERAMAVMAPEVSRPIAGQCPECGSGVEAPLHVSRLVVGEMVRDAAALPEEVDLIAQAYHWPEADILALPRARRRAYAERIRNARRAA
ncbi:MAG TPA: hypothetical protein VGM25_10210 [Caulobacteraceae bacterium]|jgi:hypothetical protein